MSLDTIFCTQCGTRNPIAARFCDQCGAPLVKPGAAAGVAARPLSAGNTPTPVVALPPPIAAPGTASAQATTISCPQCGIAALPGEAFCDNCGAPLNTPIAAQPQPVYPPPQPTAQVTQQVPVPTPAAPTSQVSQPPTYPTPAQPPATQPVPQLQPVQPLRTTLAPAQLEIVGSGARITLPASSAATIGRADPASSFFPDVDLTPHGALEQGVGRRHLRLTLDGGRIRAEDLDSTNGSAVNGTRLPPYTPQALNPGDTLTVGRLVLRLIV